MAEKVNKSNTSLHYHSLINLCALYLSCYLAQRRAEALQFMILPQHIVGLVTKCRTCILTTFQEKQKLFFIKIPKLRNFLKMPKRQFKIPKLQNKST